MHLPRRKYRTALQLSDFFCENPFIVSLFADGDVPTTSVEIDESWVGKKAKYHKGTSRSNTLVLGIVETHGRRCILYMIPRRDSDSIISKLKKHVASDCVVNHDDYSVYRNLQKYGYEKHGVVNHSLNFKSPDGVHTNTIEGLWGLFKQRISISHGCHLDRYAVALDEFSYRQNNKDKHGSIWHALLTDLAAKQ
jgi:hypothetical protein